MMKCNQEDTNKIIFLNFFELNFRRQFVRQRAKALKQKFLNHLFIFAKVRIH